jgi:hypothetical protein
VKVAVVFEPDPDLGHDPMDETKETRRLGVFIDSDKEDVLLVHRRYGEQFKEGIRTDIYASGVWENVDLDRFEDAIGHIEAFGDDEETT